MARYIDADKLIEHLKDEIKACEPSVGSRANGRSVAYGTKLGLQSAISFAETLATADVAPKREVERLIEDLQRSIRADAKVGMSAGEILLHINNMLVELKKKYTEEKE